MNGRKSKKKPYISTDELEWLLFVSLSIGERIILWNYFRFTHYDAMWWRHANDISCVCFVLDFGQHNQNIGDKIYFQFEHFASLFFIQLIIILFFFSWYSRQKKILFMQAKNRTNEKKTLTGNFMFPFQLGVQIYINKLIIILLKQISYIQ